MKASCENVLKTSKVSPNLIESVDGKVSVSKNFTDFLSEVVLN